VVVAFRKFINSLERKGGAGACPNLFPLKREKERETVGVINLQSR